MIISRGLAPTAVLCRPFGTKTVRRPKYFRMRSQAIRSTAMLWRCPAEQACQAFALLVDNLRASPRPK